MPQTWLRDCSAGEEIAHRFLEHHEDSSVWQPEATRLAHGTAFNHHNVNAFFVKLGDVYSGHWYGPEATYSCDETGLTTVHRPIKVTAAKGSKQVGTATSQELTLYCECARNTIPRYIILENGGARARSVH